ncbi:MAG: hypothetical protein GAK28_00918 [Luteibacter sp.]|uniref:CPBP family intramembrane glutamic endopeptidase n=1 Tax=Luteibacter sp. TaxID=1886636 RepID=UPI0013804632|nr:CPBP family intramembrane glutamic endopeptidase [Luteibacter sp.]KAF1008497.1 MAG: hypothetical protein GAK28_00918 [Luteibacter sp.]
MPHDTAPAAVALPVEPSPLPARAPGLLETIACIIAYFVLQLGFGALFGLISQFITQHYPDQVPAYPDRLIVVVILTLLCAAGVTTALLVRRWGPRSLDGGALGLGFTPPQGKYIAIATGLGLAAPIVGGLLTQFLAGNHEVSQSVSEIAGKAHIGMRFALLPAVVLVGPLVEETLFRGALLAVLRHRLGDGWTIGISATIFGLVHLPDLAWLWYAVPNLALIGLICAWLRVRSGSIWPAFVAHAVNNSLATLGWFTG